MATGGVLEDVEPSDMECTICQLHYTLPKILPCGHLVCRQCVLKWLESKPDAGCPICRCAILEGQDKQAARSVPEMVDDFPTDLAMTALVEAHSLLSKQHVCCICDKVADSLCLDCGDMFCSKCEKMHTKQPILKHHKLEKLSTLTTETLAARRPAMCADHKEEACKVYCPTHGASVCFLCATTTHRKCEEVVSLQARMQQSVAELDQLTALLTDGETKLDVSLQELDQHIKDMHKRADDALQQIQATCQRLESALKDFRRRLQDMTRKARDDVTQDANDVKAALLPRRCKLTSHKTVTGRATSHTELCSVADVTAQLKGRITQLHTHTTAPITDKQVRSFTFTLDPEAVSRIERELSQLGKVTFTPVTGITLLQGVQSQSVQSQSVQSQGVQSQSVQSQSVQPQGVQSQSVQSQSVQPQSVQSQSVQSQSVQGASAVPTEFVFHPNHGTSVQLSNNNMTAQRTCRYNNEGVVVARDAMQPHMLYEVGVEEVNTEKSSCLLGVLTTSPDTFTLPANFTQCGASGLGLWSAGYVYAFGTEKQDDRLKKLLNLTAGTRVGLALDASTNLHLYIEGKDEGVVGTHIPQPAYFVFDLYSRCTKVTAQPVKRTN